MGPFRLLEQIGEGGMGVVHLAERREPVAQRVALKVIRTDRLDRTYRARFAMEQQALARMDHPNIARLLDAGTDGPQSWFAMEYVPGQPLSDYCREHRLSVQQRLQLFVQICDGVQHAHIKGILHRDLKPANILVREVDGRPVAKIIDFGLAQPVDPLQIRATLHEDVQQVVGTVAYMSPEQAARTEGDLDTRTDVYSLGVVLYEMLTGELPIDLEDLRKRGLPWIGAALREQDPQKPSTRLSEVGDGIGAVAAERSTSPQRLHRLIRGDLDWVTMKALARDRQARYPTVRELGHEIERFLRHRPVEAGPPSAWYALRKWFRRHAVGVAVAGGIGLVGLAVAVAAEQMTARARAAEARRDLLAKGVLAGQYVQEAREDLWPADESRVEAMEAWLEAVDGLSLLGGQLAAFEAELGAALGSGDGGASRAVLLSQQALVASGRANVAALADVRTLVVRRVERARTLRQRTVDAYRAEWATARSEVAADPRFVGFVLPELPGLVPLGRNPHSGLQEFHLLESAGTDEHGSVPFPHRDDRGGYEVGPHSGIVFVLVPGGTFRFAPDDNGRPAAQRELAPFLISRHETTQAQWARLAEERRSLAALVAANPSNRFDFLQSGPGVDGVRGADADPAVAGWRSPCWVHPLQQVSWRQATAVLRRHGLALPTMAQWIWAAEGGPGPALAFSWVGESVGEFVNARDDFAEAAYAGAALPPGKPGPTWDGFVFTSPVHALRPNPHGLHHVFGNVAELVRDGYEPMPSPTGRGPEQAVTDAVTAGVTLSLGGSMLTVWKQRAEDFTHQVPLGNVEATVGFRAVFPLPGYQ